MVRLTASLVIYETPAEELQPLFTSLQQSQATWVVVDNSASESEAAKRRGMVLVHGGMYVPASGNLGFGAGHNLALQHLQEKSIESSYHLVVNPDIEFVPAILERLSSLLDRCPDVGWVMPQVRFRDGTVQPLCKLLPTPMDLFGRRFLTGLGNRLMKRRQEAYELRGGENTASTTVPFLSGCFIFARRQMLQQAGGFDDRYFMYMEDVDLCRRMSRHTKLMYWPEVSVVHGFSRGSHHDLRLTFRHVQSAIRYFNRWGWFFDRARDRANQRALNGLHERTHGRPE